MSNYISRMNHKNRMEKKKNLKDDNYSQQYHLYKPKIILSILS